MNLTASSILAAATDVLSAGEYAVVPEKRAGRWLLSEVRVFEDRYSVVAVAVFDSWHSLLSGWPDAQGSLVDLMAEHLSTIESKSWDGYLVLLTPGMKASDDRTKADEIERNMSRVRKLVATGDELNTIDDVERTLLPLLPMKTPAVEPVQVDVLQILPRLLARRGVSEEVAKSIVDAFAQQESVFDRLHHRGI